ncbi:MAG: response regulator [Elusimicrobia bacterium]|nr:response regulator [Candidatus Liberimonas magnetica]
MSYTILIVDDEQEFREELKDYFCDYNIIEASNTQEALDILKKPHEIDLVLLDVMMPGKRGTEVVATIKKVAPGAGIIILTGSASVNVAVEALRGKVDDFIEKPFDKNKLQMVESFLLSRLGENCIPGGGKKSKVERVRRFLEKNFDKKVCLSDAASAIAVSPKYLSRLFKDVLNIGFNEYRINNKIEKAKEWLENSEYNVDEIAYKLGYENTGSFIKTFKMAAKCTPSEFRQKKTPQIKGKKKNERKNEKPKKKANR